MPEGKVMKILDLPPTHETIMETEPNTNDIINPEVPSSGAEKLALLHRCMEAIDTGARVEGDLIT